MRLRNIFYYGSLSLCLLLTNCSDNEPKEVFKESATQRLKKRSSELKKKLQAPQYGWKTVYFTDNSILGGYRFLFDFEDDKTVAMSSDFSSEDYAKRKSEYDVVLGSTVKLSFTTKNSIHKLSESDRYPQSSLRGKGYKGNFEFLYYGTDGDDLIFRTNRELDTLRLSPAKQSDWDNLKKGYEDMSAAIYDPKKSTFRALKIGDIIYNFDYNQRLRHATSTTTDSKASKQRVEFGVGFELGEIVISPAIDVDGKKVNKLQYDKAKDRFSAKIGDKEQVALYYADAPLSRMRSFSIPKAGMRGMRINRTNPRYVSSDNSSESFVTFFNKWRDDFKKALRDRYRITRFYIRGWNTAEPYISIWINNVSSGGNIGARYGVKKTESRDKFGNHIVKFSFNSSFSRNNDAGVPDLLKPIIDFMFDPKGFYVVEHEQARTSAAHRTDFYLISVDKPSYRIHWYYF